MADFTGFHWLNSDGTRIGVDTEHGYAFELDPGDFDSPYGWTRFSHPGRLLETGVWGELKHARSVSTPAPSISIQNRFCNRACPYCSSHVGAGRNAEAVVWDPIPDAPPEMSGITVTLSSGEPLMNGPFADAVVDWIDRHEGRIKKVQVVTALKFKTLHDNPLFRRLARLPGIEMGVTVNGYQGIPRSHARFGTDDFNGAMACVREAVEAGFDVRVMSLANSTTLDSMRASLAAGAQSVGLFTILRMNETMWPFSVRLDDSMLATAWAEHQAFHRGLTTQWASTPRIGSMIVNNCHQLISDLLGGRQTSYPVQLDTIWPRAKGSAPWVTAGSPFCTRCDQRQSDQGCLAKVCSPAGCDMVHSSECLRCPAYRGCFYKRSHTTCTVERTVPACDTVRWDVAAALALRLKDLPLDDVQNAVHGGCSTAARM